MSFPCAVFCFEFSVFSFSELLQLSVASCWAFRFGVESSQQKITGKENGEGHLALPVSRSESLIPPKLEADAQTKLHLTGCVDLPFQSTPIVRFTNDESGVTWVKQLIMVEHVRED